MPKRVRTKTVATPPRVAIVASRYNGSITDALVAGAQGACAARTGRAAEVIAAPGAFELPTLCLAAAQSGRFDGVVAIGCLIKGDTPHDRIIADAVAAGLVNVTLGTGIPVAFGVLTVNTPAQAGARAGGRKGNKGQEAMEALLDTLDSVARVMNPGSRAGASRASRKPDKAGRR